MKTVDYLIFHELITFVDGLVERGIIEKEDRVTVVDSLPWGEICEIRTKHGKDTYVKD